MNDAAHRPPAEYQFGDSDLAAERLRRLADVFNPSSRAFLQRAAIAAPREIADLGCGPGHTTRMLAEAFPTARVRGIDCSPHFVELARRLPAERTDYVVADVTQALPGGPFDVIYCRYLLAHLTAPLTVVRQWSAQLRCGGVLCLEENDWIRTTQPAFARYLEIVVGMLAAAGQQLYIGADLDGADFGDALAKRESYVAPVEVTERTAAEMFLPNLATWRQRDYVRRRYSQAELDRLRQDLQQMVDDDSTARTIVFGLRRLVFAAGAGAA